MGRHGGPIPQQEADIGQDVRVQMGEQAPESIKTSRSLPFCRCKQGHLHKTDRLEF
jgi:hypothetical protein